MEITTSNLEMEKPEPEAHTVQECRTKSETTQDNVPWPGSQSDLGMSWELQSACYILETPDFCCAVSEGNPEEGRQSS